MCENVDIAIIGGSGVYDVNLLDRVQELDLDTPFGKPSDTITVGEYGGTKVCFLPRHGLGHRYSPTEVPYRANIFALKKLGVKRIISASAVGSLKEEYAPLDIVVPDQLYDRTSLRKNTFFEDGIVVHMGFADPFCPEMSSLIVDIARSKGYSVKEGGTYVCMDGPQFSTRAESRVYQTLGFDIIGMTAIPEAKLAREAEICYSMIATVTDYDVWKDEDVTIEAIIENAMKNEVAVRDIIADVINSIPSERACSCKDALHGAITTVHSMIPVDTRTRLQPLIGRYMEQ
ncbi:S-methyl-5'-thioadenosine phosphorylase [uncultured Methanomethylovorans sp.]|uniref:S-methyl-5'-thioadenosine phosphorylase n=1 Tax=uncultured Methanomethylovorans sp. TaxID=183759 RepID=UPI002AA663CD|nr:S-methyl-5'-thioadenosine phosphorylase [uncultured Methanomethylovorans sp.]